MDEATKKIIRDLAINRPRTKIITELCETYRLKWDQAENLVDRIEKEHTIEIQTRQKPFYILLGGALLLGGLSLSAFMIFASLNGLDIYLLRLPIPYLGNVLLFILGILAFLGGLRVMIRIIRGKNEPE
jgi:hypothetical protein